MTTTTQYDQNVKKLKLDIRSTGSVKFMRPLSCNIFFSKAEELFNNLAAI